MNDHASAWKPLIDDWVERERRMRPDAPILGASVRVRDAVEIDDQAYVLVSYDVDFPWPAEEDAPGNTRSANTAVLQAMRVRQPWIERDATRALSQLTTEDRTVVVAEHLLGTRRAYSGSVEQDVANVTLRYDDGSTADASVVDGWFLAVVPESRRLEGVAIAGAEASHDGDLQRVESVEMLNDLRFARSAGHSMYFSPLDLRGALPLVQWERLGSIVVVAVCLEQYDEGGVLRLRIDGVRQDDDVFVSWPKVTVECDGEQLASAVCGEYSLADTITMDIGFRPWRSPEEHELVVHVAGLRGEQGATEPVALRLKSRPVAG